MEKNRRRVHYVLSSHWDREWYQAFQDYRYRLVHLLDKVLEGWANETLQGPFQTDGQAIILDDYLEVRPQLRAKIQQLVREGKFKVGPWYVLPDEFIVSGESIIRNLELGFKIARQFGGEPSKAGFMCDIFGHNSQMPQIFKGFGIKTAFIWRGTNQYQKRLFHWHGADGTVIPAYRFGKIGYCDYALFIRQTFQDGCVDCAKTSEEIKRYLADEAAKTDIHSILMFDGCDHHEWHPQHYAVLMDLMEQDTAFEIVHSDLDAFCDDVLAQESMIQEKLEGELRQSGKHPLDVDQQWLIPGVLSSRAWIKQSNTTCQDLLCLWAEPISTVANLLIGEEYPRGFLDVAWQWLLQNHPHDSICGCSIDIVHEDMKFRFSQTKQIAERLSLEATQKIAANIEGSLAEGEQRLVVFNPLTQPFDQVTEINVALPQGWNTFNEFFGFEPKPGFRVYDPEGNEIPYQRLSQDLNRTKVKNYTHAFKTTEVQISLPLQIPSMGYTSLTIRPAKQNEPTRYPEVPGLATSERSMQNEFISVSIESNGTLTITDRETGEIYSRLLTFEDCADIGDGWYHGIAVNDQVVVSSASSAMVTLVHNGPNLTTFRIRTEMMVPAEFDFAIMKRSEQWEKMVVISDVSLRKGCKRVEVATKIDNQISDHRVRVLFPSGAKATTSFSDTPFDVVERPIALGKDNHTYRELEVETKPQQTWTAVFDDHRGLAVISVGQMECAVRDLPDRPVALTLFRGTRRTVMTDGEPNGQLHGEMTFRYWILPLVGEPDRTQLCRLGQTLAAGIRTVQLDQDQINRKRGSVLLSPKAGFLQVDGNVVVTSFRKLGERAEIRFFNPTNSSTNVIVQLAKRPIQAALVNFDGGKLQDLQLQEDGRICWEVGAKKIQTLCLMF